MPRFSETLREHAQYPSNQGPIVGADLVGKASLNCNPPYITLYLKVSDDVITRAGFESAGCGVTTAICSVTTELIEGTSLEDCKLITVDQVCQRLDGVPPDKRHCVLVVLKALNNALGVADQ